MSDKTSFTFTHLPTPPSPALCQYPFLPSANYPPLAAANASTTYCVLPALTLPICHHFPSLPSASTSSLLPFANTFPTSNTLPNTSHIYASTSSTPLPSANAATPFPSSNVVTSSPLPTLLLSPFCQHYYPSPLPTLLLSPFCQHCYPPPANRDSAGVSRDEYKWQKLKKNENLSPFRA